MHGTAMNRVAFTTVCIYIYVYNYRGIVMLRPASMLDAEKLDAL